MNFAEDQRRPTKHFVALGVVVALHILLGYALVSGLARRVIEVVKAPIETKIIEEVKPPPPPPPENLPPPPKFAPPPPSFVPPPEVAVNPPPVPVPVITTTQETPPPQPVTVRPTAPEAPPPPVRVAARPAIADPKSCAPKEDDYPAAAVRAEATGTTKIRFTIDGDGKLVKTEIVKSAGSTREHKLLDRTVVDKLSTCKFTPGVDETGKRVGASFDVDYVWKLQ